MCEFVCVICSVAVPVGFIIAVVESCKKVEKHYCHKGRPHDWAPWVATLENREHTCKRCGITEVE